MMSQPPATVAMPAKSQPNFAAIATRAFPAFAVSGTGPFAIRFRCARVIHLYEKFSDAAAERDHVPCMAKERCRFSHDYIDLRRIQTEPAPRWVCKPHWAKEIARDEAAV